VGGGLFDQLGDGLGIRLKRLLLAAVLGLRTLHSVQTENSEQERAAEARSRSAQPKSAAEARSRSAQPKRAADARSRRAQPKRADLEIAERLYFFVCSRLLATQTRTSARDPVVSARGVRSELAEGGSSAPPWYVGGFSAAVPRRLRPVYPAEFDLFQWPTNEKWWFSVAHH
jgi:hypothetical protein